LSLFYFFIFADRPFQIFKRLTLITLVNKIQGRNGRYCRYLNIHSTT